MKRAAQCDLETCLLALVGIAIGVKRKAQILSALWPLRNGPWSVSHIDHQAEDPNLDLSRFNAAPSVRLIHLSLKGDRAFPAQR
jgi:hypothetical protein